MKERKIKISWRIFSAFVFFIAFIIALLWLFQVVFLNDIYQFIRNRDIKNAADLLASCYSETEDMTDDITKVSLEKDVCIMMIDAQGGALYNCHSVRDCVLHKLSNNKYNLMQIYHLAEQNGGNYFESFETGFELKGFQSSEGIKIQKEDAQSNVIYIQLVPSTSGEQVAIIVNSTVVPLTSTVKTLNLQLIFITAIMLVLAVLIAFIMSRRISRPIVEINKAAKELSQGNYQVNFSTRGDKEIAELSDTLNYTASELSKTEQFRKDLIANISHDMRTPLTMITGYGEVMRDIPGENTPENIQIIIDEANRLSMLVNDALDISKLQSGTMELQPVTFNLTECIRNTINRYQKLIKRNGYRLDFEFDNSSIFVFADEVKLTQVIYNLMTNAINYTGQNKMVIVRQIVDKTRNTVCIEFEDFGEGIPKEQFRNIWDRYYKIDKTHKRGTVGTGLGLSIVRTILELHKARYGVRSTLGKGSIFWFELPLSGEN